jgi:enoyl-CoA hydratase/carnithine racemase
LTYSTIQYEQRGHTVCITLDRPERLNAISDEMIRELTDAYATVERMRSALVHIVAAEQAARCVGEQLGGRPWPTTRPRARPRTSRPQRDLRVGARSLLRS